MNKQEFQVRLRQGLSGLSQEDIEERLTFYSEMIDDRMEEGLTEEEAVSAIGSVDEIVSQILSDTPLSRLVKEKIRPKRTLRAWEIVFLVLGSPIWLSLLIAAASVIFALFTVLWAVIISIWAVEVSLISCFFGSIVSGVAAVLQGGGYTGAVIIGMGLICAGLSVFLFFGCRGATKGILLLTKKIIMGIKSLFVRKDNAQ